MPCLEKKKWHLRNLSAKFFLSLSFFKAVIICTFLNQQKQHCIWLFWYVQSLLKRIKQQLLNVGGDNAGQDHLLGYHILDECIG